MKILMFLAMLVGCSVNATELVFVNHSGYDARITQLNNKCDGTIIDSNNVVFLKNNEEYVVKKTTPVVHIYTVCGAGYCSDSAIGLKDSEKYVLEIVLKDWMIDINPKPDHWVGNLDCPK